MRPPTITTYGYQREIYTVCNCAIIIEAALRRQGRLLLQAARSDDEANEGI